MKLFKPNIYFSPDQIRNFLNDPINFTLENIQCYCNDPVSDFTRNRLLSTRTLIDCILSFSNYSTTIFSPAAMISLHLRLCVKDVNYQTRISLSVSIIFSFAVLITIKRLMVITFLHRMTLILIFLSWMIPKYTMWMVESHPVNIISMLYMTVLIIFFMFGVLMLQAKKVSLMHYLDYQS